MADRRSFLPTERPVERVRKQFLEFVARLPARSSESYRVPVQKFCNCVRFALVGAIVNWPNAVQHQIVQKGEDVRKCIGGPFYYVIPQQLESNQQDSGESVPSALRLKHDNDL